MSSDKEQDYFSDGLSDELLSQLPQLRVIAGTSSFSFKGKQVDVATIARALNVANLLEGSVRKEGNTLRVCAQLVRAADSSEPWSQTYDRQLTDVFKIQDDISAQVVAALKLKLLPAQLPAGTGRTDNMQAYNHYLRASQLMAANTLEGWQQAIVEYQHAVDLDSGYTATYTGMANAYGKVADLGGDTHAAERATWDVNEALVLTPNDPNALATRGVVANHLLLGLARCPFGLRSRAQGRSRQCRGIGALRVAADCARPPEGGYGDVLACARAGSAQRHQWLDARLVAQCLRSVRPASSVAAEQHNGEHRPVHQSDTGGKSGACRQIRAGDRRS